MLGNLKKEAKQVAASPAIKEALKNMTIMDTLKMLMRNLKAGFQHGVEQAERGEKLDLTSEKTSSFRKDTISKDINEHSRKNM